ncbi:dTDP-glucose 4,6-dehydratase [Shumkonia mesophila]|uniref:dTDP-glucose 4,6-dehydratase n=1 Tax=Shumkonia mesophila TaxID=2838854 RepID=UPI0029341AD2|nr:dTDP-glucose 4,6-dehydratase [Shumkonia mesophila]
MKTLLVTGGCGFIGSAVVRQIISRTPYSVVNVDKMTYAATAESVASVASDPRYRFEAVDICDAAEMARIFAAYRPAGVIHLAAETHVDRSIDGPAAFIQTNIVGTYRLLDAAFAYWNALRGEPRDEFLLLHVSTDEVFGSLGAEGHFRPDSPYRPNSPYSASKASADHLVRAWGKTYGLPVAVSNCSNNYGPFQFPEKLIPLVIANALSGKSIPVYGRGENVRDWLFVEDHAHALLTILERGVRGETYLIGGNCERSNIDLVRTVCRLLDEMVETRTPRESLITYVTDRPGHDARYAIDSTETRQSLGWEPLETLDTGLRKTVAWYLANQEWWRGILAETYDGHRLGVAR